MLLLLFHWQRQNEIQKWQQTNTKEWTRWSLWSVLSIKLSLKIFVILPVLAHFIYIDSINNHISNHYKRKWFTITGYLRGSTLHMSSKYFSLLHSSLQDSWFWLHHSQGHQSHHPLSKSTVYQIGLLKKHPNSFIGLLWKLWNQFIIGGSYLTY